MFVQPNTPVNDEVFSCLNNSKKNITSNLASFPAMHTPRALFRQSDVFYTWVYKQTDTTATHYVNMCVYIHTYYPYIHTAVPGIGKSKQCHILFNWKLSTQGEIFGFSLYKEQQSVYFYKKAVSLLPEMLSSSVIGWDKQARFDNFRHMHSLVVIEVWEGGGATSPSCT